MDKARSVLVTGATGFIGRSTVASLEQAGWVVTRGVRASARSLEEGEIYLDLNNPAEILATENGARFDAIVHLGACIGWSGAMEAEMFAPNVLATGCLAFLASQWNAHLVYASAAIVCGVKSEKIDVTTPVNADTAYAKSKRLGEQLIEASHVPHCILRIGGVFGPNGPAHLGLNQTIQNALEEKIPTLVGSGTARRNYIYVEDLANTIVFTLHSQLTGCHLIAGSESLSIKSMLESVCEVFLPGTTPEFVEGSDAKDQIIQPSPHIPKGRLFKDGLNDILTKARELHAPRKV